MKLLAIDTSGAACSAALRINDRVLHRFERAPRRHGELILSMADALLREADLRPAALDALAFGRGPGAFTGLRIAAAVTQGIALGAGLPVVGISTLAALAQGAARRHGAGRVLAAFDARMDEVYWGAYAADEAGLMRPLIDDQVCGPDSAPVPPEGGWYGVGSGWGAYRAALACRAGEGLIGEDAGLECDAWDVATLAADALARGEGGGPESAVPLYLRNRVTATPRT